MNALIRLVRKKDNLLTLLSLIPAFAFGVLGFASNVLEDSDLLSVVLMTLSVLAVGQIVERETRLERMSTDLDGMRTKLDSLNESSLLRVNEIPPLDAFMRGAEELFYNGGHLHSLVHANTHSFREWLKSGKSLKLLLQNPENPGLRLLSMPCVNYNGDRYVAQIRASLDVLRNLKRETGGDLQVRVTDVSPTQSVAILDGHKGGSELCMLLHLPEGEGQSAPFMRLNRADDREWFDLFVSRYYCHLWQSATVVI